MTKAGPCQRWGSEAPGARERKRREDKAGGCYGVGPGATCVYFVLKRLCEEKGKIWEGRGGTILQRG